LWGFLWWAPGTCLVAAKSGRNGFTFLPSGKKTSQARVFDHNKTTIPLTRSLSRSRSISFHISQQPTSLTSEINSKHSAMAEEQALVAGGANFAEQFAEQWPDLLAIVNAQPQPFMDTLNK
jgi:hypothetical protein